MMPSDLILVLLTGGLLGMVGQGMRTIVGLKKVYDQSMRETRPFAELFAGSQVALSLLIGFVAGILGIISISDLLSVKLDKQTIATLIGIGYAGSDFIEGFIKKYAPSSPGAPGAANENQPAVG